MALPTPQSDRISVEDSEWDAFVSAFPQVVYTQTSLWAEVRAQLGWQKMRLAFRHQGRILAGAQLFFRKSRALTGVIGYVPYGPLIPGNDPDLCHWFIEEFKKVSRDYNIRYLAIHPPLHELEFSSHLERQSFVVVPPTQRRVQRATMRFDVSLDDDTLLSRMKKSTRQAVLRSQRRGVSVREGTERELAAFYQMMIASAQRRGFTPESEAFITGTWHLLNQHGAGKLFLIEYEGELLSGQIVILHGDTVLAWRGGWSGQQGDRYPNNAMDWAGIQWARDHGYRYYDFGGIDYEAALPNSDLQTARDTKKDGVRSYKEGYRGEIVVFPEPRAYIHLHSLKLVYRLAGTIKLPKLTSR